MIEHATMIDGVELNERVDRLFGELKVERVLDRTFVEFPKINRLKDGCIITEKIDGTNAQIHILEDGTVLAGSRNRYVTPEVDNYNWARWVKDHEDELRLLGPGRHYGEWWGIGIQRGYGLYERRFSLFNTHRWRVGNLDLPSCCSVVPVLYNNTFSTGAVDITLAELGASGSVAAPGFMNPEGIVVYLPALRASFKVTFDGDRHKGEK